MKQFVFLVLLSIVAFASPIIVEMDLADDNEITLSFPYSITTASDVDIVIKNMVPQFQGKYSVLTELIIPVQDPLSLDDEKAEKNPPDCADKNISKYLSDLNRTEQETEVKNIVSQLNHYCSDHNISDEQLSQCDTDNVLLRTTKTYQTVFTPGKDLVVNVFRDGKSWKKTFTSTRRDRWMIHYGLSFMENKDKSYYLKEDGNSTVITKSNNTSAKKLIPSILFSYVNESLCKPIYNICLAPTAGFGVDTSNISALFGGSLIIGDNLALTFGFSAYKAQKLRGEFTEGETVPEGEKPNELHTTGYEHAYFLSLGFRFDSNPF